MERLFDSTDLKVVFGRIVEHENKLFARTRIFDLSRAREFERMRLLLGVIANINFRYGINYSCINLFAYTSSVNKAVSLDKRHTRRQQDRPHKGKEQNTFFTHNYLIFKYNNVYHTQ